MLLLKNVKNYNYLYKLKHFKKQLEKCGNMHVTCNKQNIQLNMITNSIAFSNCISNVYTNDTNEL